MKMPLARCKPGGHGMIVLMGRPLMVHGSWEGVVPPQAFDGRYSFIEPVILPLPPSEDEFIVVEEE